MLAKSSLCFLFFFLFFNEFYFIFKLYKIVLCCLYSDKPIIIWKSKSNIHSVPLSYRTSKLLQAYLRCGAQIIYISLQLGKIYLTQSLSYSKVLSVSSHLLNTAPEVLSRLVLVRSLFTLVMAQLITCWGCLCLALQEMGLAKEIFGTLLWGVNP